MILRTESVGRSREGQNEAPVNLALALVATLASSCLLNVGYLLEHGAVGRMPPLTIRTPIASARRLLGNRRWLLGFGIEASGWALFVLALSLAPLSLVQATAAGGIGILALLVSRVTHTPLSRHERLGVGIAVAGLVLLGISLAGGHGEGTGAAYLTVALWIGASAGAALVSRPAAQRPHRRRARVRRRGRPPVRRRRHRDEGRSRVVARPPRLRRGADRRLRVRNAGPPGGLPARERTDHCGDRDAAARTRFRSSPA